MNTDGFSGKRRYFETFKIYQILFCLLRDGFDLRCPTLLLVGRRESDLLAQN